MQKPLLTAASGLWRRAAVTACAVLTLCGALALTGCNQQPVLSFQNLDITGNTQFSGQFSLPDTNGQTRTLADYHGKIVVMVFGYTHCPDVCPTTLAELSQAMQQLGPEKAARIQVLFVTLDPQRDTPSVLAQYAAAFNPSFRALRPADDAQLRTLAEDFKLVFEKVPGTNADNYTMNHTAASFVFDADGKLRLYARDAQGATPWVHDLGELLKPA
ncbi:MAG: SCO family protein [Paraburkholderia tropica]|uniref:Protein SCO1/2 n=1 Tax=Paraburkholderia tropica TaxID=92647 RepID=A0ABX5MD77_9BURK|nr:SCO family protein [Paraburkholderia tropica]MBB6323627.1 protein SCO1/2 [Paraburkholderia tropica]MDE1138489.1 SCO family protein [Paraburkholderia tropica]PXX06469.1 protein SCO1/2 [Paraburkholderia tropica]PZW72203.1 protein SCO1/2 [Paraburkholderia tropica]